MTEKGNADQLLRKEEFATNLSNNKHTTRLKLAMALIYNVKESDTVKRILDHSSPFNRITTFRV